MRFEVRGGEDSLDVHADRDGRLTINGYFSGYAKYDGHITAKDGEVLGSVNPYGEIYDESFKYVGYVDAMHEEIYARDSTRIARILRAEKSEPEVAVSKRDVMVIGAAAHLSKRVLTSRDAAPQTASPGLVCPEGHHLAGGFAD